MNDVTFIGNTTFGGGGAMFNECNFSTGSSTSSPELNRVTFIDNTATRNGGAMYTAADPSDSTCMPVLINVVFYNNFAPNFGSAMYNEGFSDTLVPLLINVTFAGNPGTAMANNIDAISTTTCPVANTIFYGNGGQIQNLGASFTLLQFEIDLVITRSLACSYLSFLERLECTFEAH